MSQTDFSVISLASIAGFDAEADVLVCGFGGAGGSAALEAAKAGARVILYERASGAGGSTGLSSCEMYLGGSGGTSLQKALGFEDSTENFIAYLERPWACVAILKKFVCTRRERLTILNGCDLWVYLIKKP